MSFYIFIIISLILLIICVLIFKTISKILGYITLIFTIILIILSGITYFAYLDFLDFQENLENPNLLVISDQEKILLSISLEKTGINRLNEEKLKQLENKEYDFLLKDYYKIIFIDLLTLEEQVPDEIEYEGKTIKKQILFDAIRYKNQSQNNLFNNLIILNKENSTEIIESKIDLGDKQRIKLLMLAIKSINTPDITKLFKQYKKGDIKIYEETILFKLAKFIPSRLLEKIIGEIN